MFNLVLRALVVSEVALGVWQIGGGSGPTAVYADLDCGDFTSQEAAQTHLDAYPDDPDGLDTDEDGTACEQYDYDDEDTDVNDDVYDCSPYQTVYNQPVASPYGYPYPYANNHCSPYQVPFVPAIVPAPSRTSHISMVLADTSIGCNEETALVARLTYPNGAGASAHMVQFQSTLGTVFSNVLTDQGGYAQTRFVAPMIPGQVQITAFGDGLTQTQTINVTCATPHPYHPPSGHSHAPPSFKPPSTGDAGLAGDAGAGSSWLLLGLAAIVITTPAAALAVVHQRR